ncbi:hypothetical protein H0H93_006841, partial [Arthromyces matolae]
MDPLHAREQSPQTSSMLPKEPSIVTTHATGATDRQLIAPTGTNIVDTAVTLADTVLKLAKDAGEVLKNVPYVKALAGVIVQIIAIRDEINTEKERSKELVDKVLDRSKVILEGLLSVANSPHKEILGRVEGKLMDYHKLLMDVRDVLKKNAERSLLSRVVNRKSRQTDLERYNRRVDDYNMDFLTDLMLQLYIAPQKQSDPPVATPVFLTQPVLPPAPEIMIGRDNERAQVIDTLLNNSRPHIAILGGGGMGKTTLALSVLNEPVVANRYPSRFFVSCEGSSSVSALVAEIADALRLPLANRDVYLIDAVLDSFPECSLLCLDNLETIWGVESMRSELEGLLSVLQIRVGILITMRGTQQPSRVTWSKPSLRPLHSLSANSSKDIFERTCGPDHPVDEFVDKLLNAVDGIPLAISLIGALLKEGHETSKSLWGRWTKAQSAVLENGGNDRLSNLETSILLSVYGPQMQANPKTIDILAMMSILPDGVSNKGGAIDELAQHLPEGYDFRKALLTMQRVSVVHLSVAGASSRLRMLSPVRAFCKERLQCPLELRNSITSFCIAQMDQHLDVTDAVAHEVIPEELQNVEAILTQAWADGRGSSLVATACIRFTNWSLYLGNPHQELMNLALNGSLVDAKVLGDCHLIVGKVHWRQNNLDEAEASLINAATLHRQVKDVCGEGDDLCNLGVLHMQRDNLDKAEALFKYAAALHRQAHDIAGEGYDLCSLGSVHMRRDNLNEAEACFVNAAALHRQANIVIGEGNDLFNLGEVHMQRCNLDEAEASFQNAAALHRQAKDVLGEGYDLCHLGKVQMRRDNLDEAEALFQNAVALHKQAKSVVAEANDLSDLGD